MVKTGLTKVQASELMDSKFGRHSFTSHGGNHCEMTSIDLVSVRKSLNLDPMLSGEVSKDRIKEVCGDAFIRFGDDGQRVHLDLKVLREIAAPGLAR